LILNGGSLIATTNTQIGGRITQAPGTKIVAKADPARQLFPTVMITRAGQSGTLSVSGGGIVDIVSSGGFSNIIVDDNTRVDFGVGSLGTATIRLSGGGKLRTDFDVGSPNNPIMLEGDGEIEVERRLIWSGTVSGAGRFIKSGSGILRFEQANTYTGGTVITEGLLELQADDRLGQAGTILELRGGTLVLEESLTMDRPILIRGTGTIATNKIVALNGVISGDTLVVSAAKLVLGNSGNSYAGIDHRAGELIGTSESLRGNIVMAEATVLTFDQATDGIFPGAISGSGRLIKAGTGRLSLTGTSSVGSETWIRGGTLAINGKLTSDVIIDAGGTLAGSKNVVGKVVLNGGKIAPGNSIGTITIDGSLDINSGTLEMAVSPTASDQIIVTGPDGFITFGVHTLQVEFEPGLYGARTYTLLSASQGIRGTIDTATAITPPANFTGRAFTTDKQVLLRLTAALGRGLTLSDNQAALTGALNATYNATDALPPGLAGLYGLTGASLDRTLTQASGEVATGLQTTTAQMTTRFLNLLLNPFMDGQSDLARARPVPGGAEAAAHASGWSVWASGLYGSDSFDGNAAIGSHQLSNTAQSFVMGADYGVSASTIIGVALGVGGSQWSLDDSLGKGDGTALELGVYGITNWGPVYLSGALSFINNWASTDRTVLGERLRADIDAQSYGGRIEAGYRWATGFGGITPYAAGQAQWFNSGEYAENAGASYALDYASQSTADQRTELGLRFDNVAANGATRQWIFNARAAWAHDWFDDPTMTASFRSLPGTSFIVEGAQRSSNLALLSAGAEVQLGRGVSLIARFNSELGNQSTTLSGTGALRLVF
jgi:autotransporter-associated beta strand protein